MSFSENLNVEEDTVFTSLTRLLYVQSIFFISNRSIAIVTQILYIREYRVRIFLLTAMWKVKFDSIDFRWCYLMKNRL